MFDSAGPASRIPSRNPNFNKVTHVVMLPCETINNLQLSPECLACHRYSLDTFNTTLNKEI